MILRPPRSTLSPSTTLFRSTNTGTTPVSITSIAITGANPGDFGQTNNCGASVAVGANCTINVTFTPTSAENTTESSPSPVSATDSCLTTSLTGTGNTTTAGL